MSSASQSPTSSHEWVDHIPVIWLEPQVQRPTRQLVIYVPPFSDTKEFTLPYLQDLAAAGFVALSLDPWQHGERGTESQMEIGSRVFGNFRRYMWPILGQTTLDLLRVIDWAVATLDVEPHIRIGGLSMGGDISVAAAGLDHRIERVAATIATPDWLRPGMQNPFSKPVTLLPPGEPDAYAQYFYDLLNPLTHLTAFAHAPDIYFICGEQDTLVPPDGVLRFQAALRDTYPVAGDHVQVRLIPRLGHMDFDNREPWWSDCLAWLTRA
ncbi:MAG TPA: prolyl oligopeptidase family serine peptidase [Ktedonobacteraceae bacterium]|nr:prolyl oligopeptidase family serine peptidase [Ktedonobacteraceae bacterium]